MYADFEKKIHELVEENNFIKAIHDGYKNKFKILHIRCWKFEKNKIVNNLLTFLYTLFTFDLEKMKYSIRFFYDINEPKGIYTKTSTPARRIRLNASSISELGGSSMK